MNNKRIVVRVSVITIIGNTLLSIIKFLAGILSNSGAMISDAIHTVSDVATTIIAMFGAYIGNSEKDYNHQYGHERIECVASLILAFILFLTGLEIGIEGIKILLSNNYE